jgi:DNA modification methylase
MTVTILEGDALTMLRGLPSDHFGCVITSPPYWGLRDYGVDGQIGMEQTMVEHIAALVEVFAEVMRVLHPAGVLWLNYGDCYATAPNGRSAADTKAAGNDDRTFRDKPMATTGGVLKPKDLCLLPARLAIALQEAGWWVRADITWGKPKPMPDSSGVYRPGMASERIYMLAKSDQSDFYVARDTGEVMMAPDLTERCGLTTKPEQDAHRWIRLGHFYDAEAVRQTQAPATAIRLAQDIDGQNGSTRANGGTRSNRSMKAAQSAKRIGKKAAVGAEDKKRGHARRHAGFNERWDAMTREEQTANGRLLRSWEPAPAQVWEIGAKPFKESHFATFPPELVERCIKAGCPPGMPILDPFGGAGTTGLVADRFMHDCTLIERNPEYVALARARLATGLVKMDRKAMPPPAKDGLFAIKDGDPDDR